MKALISVSLLFIIALFTGCLGSSSSSTAPALAFIYIVGQGDNSVHGISQNTTGDLSPLSVSSFATNPRPTAIVVHPSKNFIYVPNFTANTVAGFNVNHSTGILTPVGTALPPVPVTGQTGPVALGINSAGTFLYVLNQGSGSISTFSIDPAKGLLTEVPGTTATPANPQSLVISPSAGFLYVGAGSTVSGFSIGNNGALTPIAGPASVGAGATVAGITVDSKGQFLYAADSTNNKVASFSIQAGSGALTPVAGSPFAAGTKPVSVAVDSTAAFVYVANQGSNNLSAFKASSGVLTQISGSPYTLVSAGTPSPSFVMVDLSNTFVYVANPGTVNIAAFGLKASDGTLTLLTTSPFGQSVQPVWMATTQ